MTVGPVAIPAQRNAALPGALLMTAGVFLIVWALRDWGVIGQPSESPNVTRHPDGGRSAGGEW